MKLERLISFGRGKFCGEIDLEASSENGRFVIDGRSLTVNSSIFAFDFDLDATLPGYFRHAKHSEPLHRHHVKVESSSLPAPLPNSS